MSGRLENLVEKAQAVDCGRYSLKCTEFLELAEWTRNNFIEGLSVMFRIGFMKGQRAEKARQKRKKVV